MTKLITYLIAGLLLCTASLAAQTITFSVDNQTAAPGEQFCVPVKVSNFNSVGGFQFTLSYDPSVLRLRNTAEVPPPIRNINLPDMQAPPAQSSFGVPQSSIPSNFVSNVPEGRVTVIWIDNTFLGLSRPDGTTIFEVCFTVLENPGVGSTQISFSNSPVTSEAFAPTGAPFTFNGQAGTITIPGGGTGGGGSTFRLTLPDRTADPGTQVCLNMATEGFTDIVSWQFHLRYDPARLEFASVGNFNPSVPGLGAQSVTTPGQGVVQPGRIVFGWDSPSSVPVTLTDGSTLLQVCFNVLATGGPTTVSFSDDQLPFEARNSSGTVLPFNFRNSTITVAGGANSDTFRLSLPDATAESGTQVCLDMTMEGFNDVISWQFHLRYDPARLQFASIGNYNMALPGFGPQSVTTPGQGVVQPGRIVLGWDSSTGLGVTVPDGSVLLQVCFNVIGNGGSTMVSFSDDLLPFEVRNSTGTILPFNSRNGTVTISGGNGGGGNSDVFQILVADANAMPGTQVCMNVTVEGYNDIISWQFHLRYDPARLQFVSVGNYNAALPGLGSQSVTVPGQGVVQPGRIVFGWDSSTGVGVTVPDGSTLFQVCFNVLAGSGTATVNFSDDQLPYEVRNGAGTILPFNFRNGTVFINSGGGGGVFTMSLSDKTVASGEQVCVDFTVDNMIGILGISTSFSYNPSHLQFVSLQGLTLPDAALFGLPNAAQQPTQPGTITMVWTDASLTPLTRPNGSVLLQLCFNVIAPNGTTTMVRFSSTPTATDVVNNGGQAQFEVKNATIDVRQTILALGQPTITNVNCFGASTGAIALQVQGGSGNFSYNWSNGATTQNLSNIAAGTYNVTVTDNTISQMATASYTVTQGTEIIITPTVNNVDCGTTNTGSIFLNVTGGAFPYQYNWSGSLPGNVTGQTNLATGQYSVTVTDANGCTKPSGPINVMQNSSVTISSIVPVGIDNGGGGAVNITATGGTGSYTYSWSGPNGFTSTQRNLSDLATQGEYCVTVTDGEDCSATACITVTLRLKISNAQIVRACSGDANGGVSIDVTGGMPDYTYNWSNGSTSRNLSNVVPGNYSVTVTDNQGSTVSNSYEVTAFAAIVVNQTLTDATTGVSNGAISLNVSGGQPSYTYAWNNGATTANISNLAPGEYCVTVTDSRGCRAERCFTIAELAIPLSIGNIEITDVTCAGGNDGAFTFRIQGGRAPYTITFGDGSSVQSADGNVSGSSLPGGVFSCTVRDDAGTSIPSSIDLSQPAPIQITSFSVVHDTEESGCTGRITIALAGGNDNYLVQWNAPNTGTGLQIINLCEGTFVPTVRDGRGCIQTFPGIEVNTFRVTPLVTNAECPAEASGSIALNIAGGAAPYTYVWRDATGNTISTDSTIENVAPGIYSVRVSENSGNALVRQITVGANSNLRAEVEVISDYNGLEISCPDSSDGIIEAVGRSGDGNYTYEWLRDGMTLPNTSPVLNGASAGTYEVIVTDGLGCKVNTQITVRPPTPIQVSASIRQVSCPGTQDGEIIVSATGGVSGRPYSFNWVNGTPGERLSFLNAGNYTVVATDANNCSVSATFMLDDPKPIQAIVQTTPASDNCNGSATVLVEGGTPPYRFQWNSFPNQNQQSINNLCPGPYFVRVTDSRGCATADLIRGLVDDDRFPCIEASAVMTPNDDGGDGLNDEFIINCIENFASNRLEVYNRWGQLVYQAENYDNSWRGRAQNGEILPEGPYYYVIEYIDPADGKLIQRKGSLTILRDR